LTSSQFNSSNLTKMRLILSHPNPSYVSLAIKLSNKYSQTLSISIFSYSILVLAILHISSVLRVSQIPSQPMIIKSSSFVSFLIYISGKAEIIYSSGLRLAFFLYSRSPRALVKLRLSLTLPSLIYPPAY